MAILTLSDMKRQTIRTPQNPYDKATVVSIYPKAVREVKPTITPSTFEFPAGSYEKPVYFVVGSASWWRDADPDQPLIEVVNGSITVADSIVRDYCQGLFCCNMGNSMPGLFWVPGSFHRDLEFRVAKFHEEVDKEGNKTGGSTGKQLLDLANARQKEYFKQLVVMADALWARSDHNPITISDDMKMAARNLQLQKDWMADSITLEKVNCKACGHLVDPKFPVCPNCRAIVDENKAKELGLKFVTVQ